MAKYNLKNRVVAITGSTGGLGSALAKTLVAKGAQVALLDLDGAAVEAQAKALGSNAFAHQIDVCSLESLELAMSEAAKFFGGIDIVMANAGIDFVEPLDSGDLDHFEKVVDVNLTGVWRTFKAGLPYVQQRKGYLLATSSLAAFVHSPMQSAYCASKAGVWALCDSIRLEVRHLGVGVGSLHPTFFPTPIMEKVLDNPAGKKLWRGNKGGIWKMVALEDVVTSALKGMESRSDMIVVPRQNALVGLAPGLLRRIVERIGFKDDEIKDMVATARVTATK